MKGASIVGIASYCVARAQGFMFLTFFFSSFFFSNSTGQHRLLVYAQHGGTVPMANTPLYAKQVFVGSPTGRFVQFRDSQHIYMIEFPGRYHFTLFMTVAERTAKGTSINRVELSSIRPARGSRTKTQLVKGQVVADRNDADQLRRAKKLVDTGGPPKSISERWNDLVFSSDVGQQARRSFDWRAFMMWRAETWRLTTRVWWGLPPCGMPRHKQSLLWRANGLLIDGTWIATACLVLMSFSCA